jgi:hypothetical protein
MRATLATLTACRAFALCVLLSCSAPASPADRITLASWNLSWLRDAPLSAQDYTRCRALTKKQREQLDEAGPKPLGLAATKATTTNCARSPSNSTPISSRCRSSRAIKRWRACFRPISTSYT